MLVSKVLPSERNPAIDPSGAALERMRGRERVNVCKSEGLQFFQIEGKINAQERDACT